VRSRLTLPPSKLSAMPDYEIHIAGALSETLLGAFPDFHAERCGGRETVLTATLPDQAALHGALAQIEALGLQLLEVRRCGAPANNQHEGSEQQ
jgi:hypothetical protein